MSQGEVLNARAVEDEVGIFPHYLIAAGGEEVIEHGDFGVDAEIAFGIAVGVEHPGCGRRKIGTH